MRYRFNKIELEGLTLRPSTSFSANLTGLFDFSRDIELSETTDHGSYMGMSRNEAKKLTLNVMIRNRYDFQSLLHLNGILAKGKIRLKVSLEGLGELSTYVVCQSKATSDDAGKAMSIELLMLDPYFLYKTEIAYIGKRENINDNGITFPIQFPFSFSDKSSIGSVIINNHGNCTSWGEIRIEGKISSPRITNRTTNKTMYFDELEMEENDVLIVSCDPRSRYITLNGTSRVDLRRGEWIDFAIGENSIIFESGENTIVDSPSYSCSVKCTSRVI